MCVYGMDTDKTNPKCWQLILNNVINVSHMLIIITFPALRMAIYTMCVPCLLTTICCLRVCERARARECSLCAKEM